MSIYVKKESQGNSLATTHYDLFADNKNELTGASLSAVTRGNIVCEPGSSCITLAGEALLLSSAGVWTEV